MTTVRPIAVALAGVVLTALAGCSSASSSTPHAAPHTPAAQATLGCASIIPDNSFTADIRLLVADDQAISGNWSAAEAEATGNVNGTANPTAAQTKAADDLTSVMEDLSTASQAQGSVATEAGTLDADAMSLTNTPTAAEGAAVHADITALKQACDTIRP